MTDSRVSSRVLVAVAFLAVLTWSRAADHPVIPVWPNGAPGSEGRTGDETVRVTDAGEHVVSNVHRPSLTVYLPEASRKTGAAVLVLPGGGHRELWMDHEGYAVAQWLSDHGVAAVVLKYRLARAEGSTYTVEKDALADAQRALQIIRSRAREWNLDPAKVGVMGFSAGGQLAALTAMHGRPGDDKSTDPVSRESSVPAFQALIYPGGTSGILPANGAPPAFLVCGENDRPDISRGIADVYGRFREAGVSAELHIYAGAGHGFGQRATNPAAVGQWLARFNDWLETQNMLSRAKVR